MSTRDERIKLDVTGADKSARDLNNVGDAAVKAGDSVYVMGEQADKAAKGVDELGDEAQQTTSQLSRLDRQIAETRVELTKLNAEYEKTGDGKTLQSLQAQQAAFAKLEATSRRVAALNKQLAGDAAKATKGVDPLDAIEKRYTALDRESRLRKRMADDEDGVRRGRAGRLSKLLGIGESAGQGAFGAIGSVGSSAAGSPWLLGAGAAVAAPAATFIGAAAGGAVGLGAAGAGVGLGLAGAWMGDPARYGAMWDTTIDKLQHRWLDSTKQFGGPLEDSLKVVDRVIRDLPVERIADLSKGFVGPLVEGAGGFVTNFADGFAASLEHAQPIVDRMGPELANLGHDAGDALRAISLGSEGGALALGDLTNAIGYAVKATGVLIMGFENAYEKARNFESANFKFVSTVPVVGSAVDGLKEKLFYLASTTLGAGKALGDAGDSSSAAARGFGAAAAGAAKASAEAGTLTDALTAVRTAGLGMADANIALAQGWLDLKKGLEDGKRTLDMSTQAGIDNVTSIKDQIANAEALRKQTIATGDGTVGAINGANAAYDESVEKIRQAAYAAHFNKEQVDALIKSIEGVPPEKSTEIKTPGMFGALIDSARLATTLGHIDGTYTARINISGVAGALADAARVAASLPSHAAGGTMPFSGPKLVGEKGAEIIWGSQGQYVSTAEQTAALMRGGGGGAAAAPPIVRVIVEYPDGRVIRDQLVTTASNEGKSVGQLLGV